MNPTDHSIPDGATHLTGHPQHSDRPQHSDHPQRADHPHLAGAARPWTRADLEIVDVEGELVIWDPVAGRIHRLDQMAALVWPVLDGANSIDDIADDLADVFGRPRMETFAAIRTLIVDLEAAGLLEAAPTSTHSVGRLP